MWRSPDGCAATTAAVPGSVAGRADDLDDLTLDYWRIVQRLRQTPLPRIDKDLLLAEIEEAYWRAALVLLQRPVLVGCKEAPEVLRRMADELERLEAEQAAESAGGDLDPPN